jgi:hypothetical protein
MTPKENSWIVCKKDHWDLAKNISFIVGESYRISIVLQNMSAVFVRKTDDGDENGDGQWFHYDNYDGNGIIYRNFDKYIWNYFYTLKESRKLKLKNIYESR